MIRSKAKFRRSRMGGIVWFAGFVFLAAAYWWVMSNYVIQDFWDPAYVQKYECLRACMRENPGRPLCVVFGSSRVEYGLRPGVLPEGAGGGNAPLIFNFGMGGAGLFRQFIYLRRVLEAGVRPQRVGIEIFNQDLTQPFIPPPDTPELQVRARRDELGDYAAFSDNPSVFMSNWEHSRWDPTYAYGMRMEGQTLTLRLIPVPWIWRLQKNPYDKFGRIGTPLAVGGDFSAANFALAKGRFEGAFKNFKVAPKNDVVLRKMLDLCKGAGINVLLLRMPENGEIRALKETAQVDEAIETYLAGIREKYPVPVIDGRLWIAQEGFGDAYHLNPAGGAEFTLRLAGEISALKP